MYVLSMILQYFHDPSDFREDILEEQRIGTKMPVGTQSAVVKVSRSGKAIRAALLQLVEKIEDDWYHMEFMEVPKQFPEDFNSDVVLGRMCDQDVIVLEPFDPEDDFISDVDEVEEAWRLIMKDSDGELVMYIAHIVKYK